MTYRHTTRSCVVPSICIAYTSHLQAIYAQLPAFLSSVLEKLAWVSSIKTANQPSRVRFRRGDRRIFHPFAGLRAELLQYSFQAPRNACGSEAQLRAARSQARALATAAAPRPVVFFSPPSIPARHTSHLSRPSCSNKHHLPAARRGPYSQARMVRHSPHPILSAGIVHGPALLWSHLFASRPSHLR